PLYLPPPRSHPHQHPFPTRRSSDLVKQAVTNRHVLWLHAVSVGEVNVATQLIAVFERRLPNLKIVVSTTTSTGMGELHRKLPSQDRKSTRLNSSHGSISYAVFCLKK